MSCFKAWWESCFVLWSNGRPVPIHSIRPHPQEPMMRQMRSVLYLQKVFLVLVGFSVVMFIATEMYFSETFSTQLQPPPFALQRTYISAVCSDKRLGNAMFIYAAVVGTAKRLNASTAMETDCLVPRVFTTSAVVVSDIHRFLPAIVDYEEFGRRGSAYDPNLKKIPRQHTLLRGYFQSFMYFRGAEEILRQEFVFQRSTRKIVDTFMETNILPDLEEFVKVGVHVRRGDLLDDMFRAYGYTTPDAAYFANAMAHFTLRYSKVIFVVCSDDIEWAKNNIVNTHVVFSEHHTDIEDMAILASCDHTIMSVGSFGWWAAWLTNGRTIYYAKWPKEYSKLEYHVNKKTYFPTEWIAME